MAGAAADATEWPGGAPAAVSLTYDDGYDSQLDHVVPLLSRLGLLATFFLTVTNVDERIKEWIGTWKSGHEIGNHSLTHPCHIGNYSDRGYLRDEIEPSERYFGAHFPSAARRAFAYPCGEVKLGSAPVDNFINLLRPRFSAARTVWGPPNSIERVQANPYLISALVPTKAGGLGEVQDYLDAAMKIGGWALLVFHDIAPSPTEGDVGPATHLAILREVLKRRLWCAPMSTVLRQIFRKRPIG